MSTPLPPELTEVERALEASRFALPDALRGRVLAAAAVAAQRPAATAGWFAAAVALAAAVLLNLSSSAALDLRPSARAPRAGCSFSLSRARCVSPHPAAE